MIHSRGANAPDAEIVMAQLIQGIGGGFAMAATTLSAQGSVPHRDVAMVTCFMQLWAQIGKAIGGAIGKLFLFDTARHCIANECLNQS